MNPPHHRFPLWLAATGFLATVTFFGWQSIRLGQDNNWDLRNYHYYNAYALLHSRLGVDYAPAGIQTYLNPMVDVPFYLAIEFLRPRWAGFTFGALHGISFWLTFRLASCILGRDYRGHFILLALTCAGVGMYGAGSVSELGTTFHDLTLTPLLIGSLFLLCRQATMDGSASQSSLSAAVIASGFLLGVAVGLKYTFAIYGPGLGLALAILCRRQRLLVSILYWASGAALGFLATAGYWMYQLWSRFGNPFGYFYNGVFRSPYFEPHNFADPRFFPRNTLQSLFYPFYFRASQLAVSELPLQEARFALAYLLIVAVALAWALRGRAPRLPFLRVNASISRGEWMLLVFFASAYSLWQGLFSIYRYLLPLEIVAPLVIWVLLRQLIARPYTRLLVFSIALLLITGAMQAPNWGRVPWADTFFGIVAPILPEPPRSLVLISASEPVSFLIPAFPAQVRFVRIAPSFVVSSTRLGEDIQRIVSHHDGPTYVLTDTAGYSNVDTYLAPYRLALTRNSCIEVQNNLAPRGILFCEASRTLDR